MASCTSGILPPLWCGDPHLPLKSIVQFHILGCRESAIQERHGVACCFDFSGSVLVQLGGLFGEDCRRNPGVVTELGQADVGSVGHLKLVNGWFGTCEQDCATWPRLSPSEQVLIHEAPNVRGLDQLFFVQGLFLRRCLFLPGSTSAICLSWSSPSNLRRLGCWVVGGTLSSQLLHGCAEKQAPGCPPI